MTFRFVAPPFAASLILLMTMTGFATAQAADDAPPVGAHGLRLPATFTGTLPCADCEGIAHHLDLFADQTWQMRREWLGRSEPLVEDGIGTWHADPSRDAIVLDAARAAPMHWEVKGADRIRLMDLEGRPIESDLPYDLSAGPLDETDLSLPLGGMVTYMADAAIFEHCVTGRTYPVAIEEAWIDMERAYLEAVGGGTPLYASFEGSIALRPAMEGPDRRTVTVGRFVGVFPGKTCESARAAAGFANTFWRIATLGGAPVGAVDGRREPFLLFHADGAMNATVGCNMMRGSYERDGEGLRFGPAASTMMACPPPLDASERALRSALESTTGYILAADTLALLNEEGGIIATFAGAYLP